MSDVTMLKQYGVHGWVVFGRNRKPKAFSAKLHETAPDVAPDVGALLELARRTAVAASVKPGSQLQLRCYDVERHSVGYDVVSGFFNDPVAQFSL